MNVGRLAWRTPTGGMLWEIWGRRKLNFALHAAALLAALLCVSWIHHGLGDITRAVLMLFLVCCFLGAFLDLLTCFGYIEVDARKVQAGFPARLLLKPVSTLRLVLTPMIFGGAAVVTVLLLWNKLVLQPLAPAAGLDPLWLGAVVLSFFWWMQSIAWSLPLFPGRQLIIVIAAVIHLMLGMWSEWPANILSRWQWPILSALLVSAVLTAWIGLILMRRGRWEGPTWMAQVWSRLYSARAAGRRKKFRSSFGAQFWLEWRRNGWLLPSLSCAGTFLIIPLIYAAQKQLGELGSGAEFRVVAASLILIGPVMLSGTLGLTIARFDQFRADGELPVYIAIRPMTNGGLVIAKLAMALASSVLTWMLTLTIGCFWLVVLGSGTLIPRLPTASPHGLLAIVIGCVPVLLLLILVTWKNLIGGISAGLTGRRWVTGLFVFWKMAFAIGLAVLIMVVKQDEKFRESLYFCLPGLLIAGLAAKIGIAAMGFVWGLRRNAITARGIGWMAGGWSVCGLFLAGYTGLVCLAINQSGLWIWIVLAGFMVLPLADLAIAPIALMWNRHR